MEEQRRLRKVEETYQHEISRILLYHVRNPRLHGLTITRVKVTPDMSLARVYFDIKEGKIREDEVLKDLNKSKGFIKHELANTINMRRMPDLEFFYDETGDLERNVEAIFERLDAEKK